MINVKHSGCASGSRRDNRCTKSCVRVLAQTAQRLFYRSGRKRFRSAAIHRFGRLSQFFCASDGSFRNAAAAAYSGDKKFLGLFR